MADPAAVAQRWRQVLADVGYLRRELLRLGPRDAYVRRAQNYDEAAMREVAAFERVLRRKLPVASRDSLRRAAAARNDLQHDYINVRAAEVFDGIGELLTGIEQVIGAVRQAWHEHGVELPAPPSGGAEQ